MTTEPLPSLDAFDYHLPQERIAQDPVEPRDAARLLVAHLTSGRIEHRQVRDLPDILSPTDHLVLNRTRVFPARLDAHKDSGGKLEILLVHEVDRNETGSLWNCLIKGKVHIGSICHIADLQATVTALQEDGSRLLQFPPGIDVLALAEAHGHIPLPPYIKRADTAADRERYQTVFGDRQGSVAAPTASLHLTEALLDKLEALGITRSLVELAVGPGTFKPVQAERIDEHLMHAEYCQCPADTAATINKHHDAGGRVIAIGTTVVRTLESAVGADGRCQAYADWTRIFLHPPKQLTCVDGLLTNFHLPRSTLLMLVACMTGIDGLHRLYQEAITEQYRFYSYGDAMLLLPD